MDKESQRKRLKRFLKNLKETIKMLKVITINIQLQQLAKRMYSIF